MNPTSQEMANAALQLALVVDDEVLVAMAIADHCRDLGIPTLEAYNGVQALALLDRHPEIDTLITDVRLPGMSGPDLAREALRRRPGLAVVFVTGFAGELRESNARPWPVLYKPFDLALLEPALADAVRRR